MRVMLPPLSCRRVEPNAAPTARFSDRAGDYARYRPDYPPAAADAILAGWSAGRPRTAADVGAGTGISARLLADRGVAVLAIEPNLAMVKAAAPHPEVRWICSRAEATALCDGAVDLVLTAQAFHWFDRAAALAEFQRILGPAGRLAVMWNRRSRTDAFTLGYRQALEAIDGEAPAERAVFDPAVVAATGRFRGLRAHRLVHTQAMSLDDLLGRARSTSTVPKSGPRHDELMRLLRALHGRHADAAGLATMVYDTEVYVWDRAPG
jgi:SAM-dependent methyltransferase